mgnify:CR=1 FL=1
MATLISTDNMIVKLEEGVKGAKVYIEGTDKNTTTDIAGNYNFTIDKGEYILTSGFVMYTSVSKKIKVQAGDTLKVDFILKKVFTLQSTLS